MGVLARMAEPRDAVDVDPVAGHDGAGTGARGALDRPAGGEFKLRRMGNDCIQTTKINWEQRVGWRERERGEN